MHSIENTEISLVEDLHKCFGDLCKPRPDQIVAEGENPCSLEKQDIVKYFSAINWCELSFEEFSKEYPGDKSACLGFMTDRAFVYFLPLYLKLILINYEEMDVSYDTTMQHLTPGKSLISSDAFNGRYALYSSKQKGMIARILAYLYAAHDSDFFEGQNPAEKALTEYWRQYFWH